MNFVSIKQILASVTRNLGVDVLDKEQSIIEWAFEAEKYIGGLKSFLQTEKDITIASNRAALPSGIVKVLSVSKSGSIMKPTHAHFRGNAVGSDADTDNMVTGDRYYIQDGYLNAKLDDGVVLTISALTIPLDSDGYPKINDAHAEAVTAYCMWMIKNIDYYNGKVPQYIIKDLERRWYYLCGQARGIDGMPSSQELSEIGKYWNTLIPIKSSNGLKNH